MQICEDGICLVRMDYENETGAYDSLFTESEAGKVIRFHQGIPGYCPTPLLKLRSLASQCGVRSFFVKDESFRFGLNAFKALGGSWCIASLMTERLGLDTTDCSFAKLNEPEIHEKIKDVTFITATDGNHGRGIAWCAKQLGVKSVVYMPEGTVPERVENIRKLGADVSVTDMKYDDTVRLAARTAEENGWILVQDTSFPGYENIPARIMQGYMTMAKEAFDVMEETPTHIFLQAGVGSMAAAVAAYASDRFKNRKPVIIVVEPDKADCFFQSALAGDGKPHKTEGDLKTIMAGLACGEPCTIAWEELKAHGEACLRMPDETAEKGMRLLAYPYGDDPKIVSGESGAAGVSAAAAILRNDKLKEIRKALGIGKDSVILCFSTEGATDRANYEKIISKGK